MIRRDGGTAAERYLKRLCDRTFLSLWSYPGLFRDQGQTATSREGKEVCDLLVVFERHVIIFSDKDCQFPSSGDTNLDWRRWYRKAILRSAQQVYGAERWMKTNPTRLFLDRNCSRRFPFDLPDPVTAKYHRVVVAHDASRRSQEALGGSGSLMILPRLVGPMHYDGGDVVPFAIGQVDPSRGYVHVFDDTCLDVVLRTLDTITDLVDYLTKKEILIESGRLLGAPGEDDLLAYYLTNLNGQGEHDFVVPSDRKGVTVPEGLWADFLWSPYREAQVQADRISYQWDRMIERMGSQIMAGTCWTFEDETLGEQERHLRFLAREPRLRRRVLATMVKDMIQEADFDFRVVAPSAAGDPYYALLLWARNAGEPHEEYRLTRLCVLRMFTTIGSGVITSRTSGAGVRRVPILPPPLAVGRRSPRHERRSATRARARS